MTMHEFNQLPDVEKEEKVISAGRFISTHNDGSSLFDTYQFDSFFVQFFYKIMGSDETGIKTFNDVNEFLFIDNMENRCFN
jgi:hypothetical protein